MGGLFLEDGRDFLLYQAGIFLLAHGPENGPLPDCTVTDS